MAVREIQLSALQTIVAEPVDLFVCCGSFEERSLSVASAIPPSFVRRAIVAEHVNLHRYVAPNTSKLMERFAGKAVAVGLNSSSPIESADQIVAALEAFRGGVGRHVLVDITTFTHESLLILVELLSTVFSDRDEVLFAYNIAQEYDPGTPDAEKWLSKGIEDVRTVLGFPGDIQPGRGLHLILLHGIEAERSKQIICEYEPALLSLGRPESSLIADRHMGANRRVHEEVLLYARNTTVDLGEFSFDPVGPRESGAAILKQAIVRRDLSVVVSAMNTKLSAMGAAYAARLNREIQMCYAQPVIYNYDNYSIPTTACYLFDFPELFGGRAPCAR